MQPSMEEIATECESLLASNRLPTARWGKHPTLAYTSFRKPEEYPEGEASRQALNSAGTNTTSIFFIICIFSFTQLFNLFYSIFSYFFTIFYYKSHILLFPFLTPFCLLPPLSYFCCKYYLFPFFSLFLFFYHFSSILSKSFVFPLVISHSFFLSYNILILFPPLSTSTTAYKT